MIAFIDDHREAHGVEPICRVLPIAPSTYHAHAAKRADPGKLSARARRDADLQTEIKRVWDANFQVYGVRKVWRQLQREAIAAPRCQVARLMKRMGLAGAVRGKTVKTTHSDKSTQCPLDRVNRQFRALAGLRLCRIRYRCLCPPYRRLAGIAVSPRRLRVGCTRTGAVRSPSGPPRRPRAPQRSRRAVPLDPLQRAPA
jgi:HTH-like domain